MEDFIRNEKHLASEANPLEFRSLPRNLKVFFPGPPQPPPTLEQVPYTYEMIPQVPFKIPKQKRGVVGSWVIKDSGFVDRRQKSVTEHKTNERVMHAHKDMTEKKKVFRKAIKSLVLTMK